MTVSKIPLLVERQGCGAEISDLSYLNSGNNLNLTSEDMAVIRYQGITVNDDRKPVPDFFL